MIGIHIIAVGKLKDSWMREGCAEYVKRISQRSNVQITEIEEYRMPTDPSPAQIDICLEKEGAQILSKIPRSAHVIALCIEGKKLSSEELSKDLQKSAVDGADTACFLIGSSHGLADKVKRRADLRLSFSPMTFPHQLARVLLCEQIYRAQSIAANTKYHK